MKKIFLLALFFVVQSYAQKYELGKVTIEELKENIHPKDTTASAAILFKTGETRFNLDPDGNWTYLTEIKCKIKIYKKDGLKYANQEASYYTGGSGERLSFSDAVTYNLVNGAIVKTKMKSDAKFTEATNEKWSTKKIVLADVKVGSIIEFSYSLKSPFISNLNEFQFQEELPVNYVSYNLYIPSYFRYRFIISGYESINSEEAQIANSKFNELKKSYFRKDLPSIKTEAFVDNIRNYTSILKSELASIEYPSRPAQNLSLDWQGVVKNVYEDSDFGDELKKTGYFEKDLEVVLKDKITRDDKISAVLKFVKERVKWNEKYGYTCQQGVKKAYELKNGNVAEINLMLTAMLRFANVDANPVLVSTKSNGIALFPSRSAFNYVVSAVEIENDVILLDATDKFSMPNVLPLRTMNWTGRIIRKNGSFNEIDLNVKNKSLENVNMLCNINSQGSFEGKIRKQITNHYALNQRSNYNELNQDSYLEKLENRYDGIEISDYESQNKIEIDKPFIEMFSFRDTKAVEKIGDKLYFSPLAFLKIEENPFKLETRNYPVDFGYPFQDKYNIVINIPEGYIVDSFPKQIHLNALEGYLSFKYMLSANEKNIQLQVTTEVNLPLISKDYYSDLKEFFSEMIKKQTEKIVLKKV
ncbi:DUF3857 domain-containing protein [Flavobacterium terrae]|uniref:DUF3857 domain-containing protein n=1 Tax=Flavobacterium terrae TaxID=415425 RepID=A0A1M6BRF4_9FLAO|nr:DUF3857 domain-containing protein [Flavobacterium terrae]SHI51108.1 protein of unknown function [Flavobacterium terrae]